MSNGDFVPQFDMLNFGGAADINFTSAAEPANGIRLVVFRVNFDSDHTLDS